MHSSERIHKDQFIPDHPLLDPAEDKFGRDRFARRIADILVNKQTPDHLTVGIYGKWGEGKTSVTNFIKYYLDNEHKDQVIHLDFNPWRYKDEDQLLNSFFKQFAQGVSHKLGEQGKQIAKTLLSYSGLIVAIAEPVTGLAMFSAMGGLDKVKDIGSRAKSFMTDNDFSPAISSLESSLQNSETLEKKKKNISRQLKETGKRYIVFIDDIDRLDNREIQILFSLIKVTADFANVIYVLCFDPKVVSSALSKTYSESGAGFLEKIVQVPLNLPKARRTDVFQELLYPGLTSILKSFNFALTEEEMSDIQVSIENGLESKLDTPRLVKRFLNAVNFALPILKDEASIHDVIIVEGLRICYPSTYEYVYSNRNLFIKNDGSKYFKSQKTEDEEEETLKKYLKDKDVSLSNLLSCIFPKMKKDSSITLKVLAGQQRVSSPEYFERYFTYSIPSSDLSDIYFTSFLDGLISNSIDESVEIAKKLIKSSSENSFIRKLEYTIETDKIAASELSKVLARLGSVFSTRVNMLNMNTPIKRVSNLIKYLIGQLPQESRFEATIDALNQCTNILLVAEIGLRLHKSANTDQLFSDHGQGNLIRLIADLIANDAHQNGHFYLRSDLKFSSPLLYNLWSHSSNKRNMDVGYQLQESFGEDPAKVIEFLKAFTPLRGLDEHETIRFGPFGIDEYTKVKRLVSPKIIFDIIIKRYENEMKDTVGGDDLILDGEVEKGLVKTFTYFYMKDDDYQFNHKSSDDLV